MNKLWLVFFIILPIVAFTQSKVIIKGTITQANTNVPIFGANILIPQTGYGTTTDSLGNYEMTILKGNFLVKITHQGYFSKNIQLDATKSSTQNFTLDEKLNDLAEVEVSAKSANQNVKSLSMGVSSLNYKALKKLPTFSFLFLMP